MSPAVILAARVFDLAPEAVAGKSRQRPVVFARAALAAALRASRDPATGAVPSWPKIARIVGVGNHNSAIHLAGPSAERAAREDPDWPARRDELRGLLADWLAGREIAPAPAERRVPAAILNPVKPKNEPAANDGDALARFRGTTALLAAIAREHPERVFVGDRANVRCAAMPPVLGAAA